MTTTAPQTQQAAPAAPPATNHLVVLDPRSLEGEAALHEIAPSAKNSGSITLAIWIRGECEEALLGLAEVIDASLEDTAWRYLDAAALRIRTQPGQVARLLISDQDLGLGLTLWISQNDVTSVALPETLASEVADVDTRIALFSSPIST